MDVLDLQPAAVRTRASQERAPMPAWLAEAWHDRVVPLVAWYITQQADPERARILAALDRGPVEYFVDADRVLFGVEGRAFVAIAFDAITGIPSDTVNH